MAAAEAAEAAKAAKAAASPRLFAGGPATAESKATPMKFARRLDAGGASSTGGGGGGRPPMLSEADPEAPKTGSVADLMKRFNNQG